jgi:hypothetical protein
VHVRHRAAQRAAHPLGRLHVRRHVEMVRRMQEEVTVEAAWCGSPRLPAYLKTTTRRETPADGVSS